MGCKRALEKFGKLYDQLSTAKIQNAEQCDEWLAFYREYHELLKRYVIEKNSSQDLTNYSNQDKWTYLKLKCEVNYGCASFFLRATDMFNMDRVPSLGRIILKDNRETSMYMYASSLDHFLKHNIYNLPDEKRSLSDSLVSSCSSDREISLMAKTNYLGEALIDRGFMEQYGNVVYNIIGRYKNEKSTDHILSGLRYGIIDEKSTEDLTGIISEAKEAAVKMLIK